MVAAVQTGAPVIALWTWYNYRGFYKLLPCLLLLLYPSLLPRIWNDFLRPEFRLGRLELAEHFARTGWSLTCVAFCLNTKLLRPSSWNHVCARVEPWFKARYFVLLPTFLDLKLCRCLATTQQTFSSKGLALLVSVFVFFIGSLVNC